MKNECPRCHEKCDDCCGAYRDNCGLDQPQGSQNDLDEQYEDDY